MPSVLQVHIATTPGSALVSSKVRKKSRTCFVTNNAIGACVAYVAKVDIYVSRTRKVFRSKSALTNQGGSYCATVPCRKRWEASEPASLRTDSHTGHDIKQVREQFRAGLLNRLAFLADDRLTTCGVLTYY